MRVESSTPLRSTERVASDVRDVRAERTPATMGAIRDSLARAHVRVTGKAASPSLLDTLVAQVSVETGGGEKMFNHNFGGLKGASPNGETARYMTREVENGRDLHMKAGFRAYRTLDEGAVDYVTCMKGRYADALDHAERGDLAGFCHSLKTSGYFTAPEAEYASALSSRIGAAHHATGAANAASSSRASAAAIGGFDPTTSFATTDSVSRWMDALSTASAHIAQPIEEDD